MTDNRKVNTLLLYAGIVLGLVCAGRVALGATLQTLSIGDKVGVWTGKVNTNDSAINTEVIDHETRVAAMETGKADVSCFADSALFNACFAMDWPSDTFAAWDKDYADLINKPIIPTVSDTAYDATSWDDNPDAPSKNAVRDKIESLSLGGSFDQTGDYTLTGVWGFAGATVTGLSASSISVADSGGYWTATTVEGIFAEIGEQDSFAVNSTYFTLTSSGGVSTLGLKSNVLQPYDADLDDDAIEFVIDGGGSAITTGVKGYLEIPYNATINRVTVACDQSGSIVVDVWKDTYANYPPTDADSITASAPATISSATKSQDSTLTGWTTSVAAGDFVGFNIDSASTVIRCTVSLKVTK